MTVGHLLREAYRQTPALDADLLLALAAGATREWLYAHHETALDPTTEARFRGLLERRAAGEPLAYLTGQREFYGRAFMVTPDVLIPRPDSELLVARAAELLDTASTPQTILELGTGSGCLIISLALTAGGGHRYTATDISGAALDVARHNAATWKAPINFIVSDLWSALPRARYNLILANLPYLTPTQLSEPSLQHEPELALAGGHDGLTVYQKFIDQISDWLTPGGTCLFEIDPAQAAALSEILKKQLTTDQHQIKQDLSGHDRLVELTL